MLSFVFACPHWCVFIQTHTFLMRFRVSSNLKLPKTLMLFRDRFQKTPFSTRPHKKRKVLKTMSFQKPPLLKTFSKVFRYICILVWVISENASKSMCSQTEMHFNLAWFIWLAHQRPIVVIISIISIINHRPSLSFSSSLLSSF